MANKISFEKEITGEYYDTGGDDFNPNVRGDGKIFSFAAEISNKLKAYEGKKVRVSISVTAEEVN